MLDRLIPFKTSSESGRKRVQHSMGASDQWCNSGSVLGPALFILYINDLLASVQSSVKIFTDDTKVYHSVSLNTGFEQLQHDIFFLT